MKALEILNSINRRLCTDSVNGKLDLAIKELEDLENGYEYFYSGYGYDKNDNQIYKFDGIFISNEINLEELRKLIFQNIEKQTDLVKTIHFISISKM